VYEGDVEHCAQLVALSLAILPVCLLRKTAGLRCSTERELGYLREMVCCPSCVLNNWVAILASSAEQAGELPDSPFSNGTGNACME
jgi:hypothetical protein